MAEKEPTLIGKQVVDQADSGQLVRTVKTKLTKVQGLLHTQRNRQAPQEVILQLKDADQFLKGVYTNKSWLNPTHPNHPLVIQRLQELAVLEQEFS